MKKLLGILGTIIIAGSGMVGLVGNSPTKIKENNNLQNLNRVKRANDNKLDKPSGSYWDIKISHSTWQNILFQHDTKKEQEFRNSLFSTLNNLPNVGSFSTNDIYIVVNVIIENFNVINDVFKNKNNDDRGLLIKTGSGRWYTKNSKWWHHEYYGAFPNKWEYEGEIEFEKNNKLIKYNNNYRECKCNADCNCCQSLSKSRK